MTMEHDGHRERLRQRFQKEGLSGFAPHETLELLLTYAIPRVNVNPQAHSLIAHFGSLSGVLEAAPEELQQVDGIGPGAATLISLLLPVFRQYEQEKLMPKLLVNTYSELAAYCKSLFLGINEERAHVLCFDARLRLLATELIGIGSPTEVSISPRAIVRTLVRYNAVGAVLTHNHPSGSCEPSQEDLDLTDEIDRLLNNMGIRLYDHVIISGENAYSFHRKGLLGIQEPSVTPLAAQRPQRKLPPKPKKITQQ